MSQISPRKRLCQVVLGSELKRGQTNSAIVSVPVLHEDIDAKFLLAAHEAIFSYTPSHIRQVLPFVLHAVEDQYDILAESGFFQSFLLFVNFQFHKDTTAPLRYRTEFRENWTADTVSAMNRFEHGWAYDWICELLDSGIPATDPFLRQDLIMLARILGMALAKQEADVPAFEAGPDGKN
ncbi:MAG: hypothetical protein ABJ246_22230 [Paracoccaceae bacterium]